MTILLAYAAYGCHLGRIFAFEELQVSPQDIRNSLSSGVERPLPAA